MSRRWADEKLRPCGTRAAYRRHVRHGEKPCPACVAASRAATQPNSNSRAQGAAKLALARLHPVAYAQFRAEEKSRTPGISLSSLQYVAAKRLTYTFPDEYRALYLAAKQGRP